MSKIAFFVKTGKRRLCLGGAVFEWKEPMLECRGERTRTTIALIRPHKWQEGVAFKLLGYDKVNDLASTNSKPTKTHTKSAQFNPPILRK